MMPETPEDLDAMFQAVDGLATAASYRHGGLGPAAPVRVLLFQADTELQPFGRQVVTGATQMTLLAAEVPAPGPGDTLTVEGVVYTIQGRPLRDASRRLWRVEAREG